MQPSVPSWNCLVQRKSRPLGELEKETKVKKLVGFTVILLDVFAAACGGQPPNPLLGNWKIVARTGDLARYDTYCPTAMVFTSTTQTMTYAGKPAIESVTYNAMQTAVYP